LELITTKQGEKEVELYLKDLLKGVAVPEYVHLPYYNSDIIYSRTNRATQNDPLLEQLLAMGYPIGD
jgi:hypothetical protein